ncbi:MAG: hypothetical protein ACYCYR_07600 [Desulfobulbaceae bacterium]|jgi:hypothetical protein
MTKRKNSVKESPGLKAFATLHRASIKISNEVYSHFSSQLTTSQFGILEAIYKNGPLHQVELAPQIRHELIIRGRVYVRRDSAVAYVAGNKFNLCAGDVFWNGRKIGSYDRQGRGEINCKPIRIYRPANTDHFVLAEVRYAA